MRGIALSALLALFFAPAARAFVFLSNPGTGAIYTWPAPVRPQYNVNPGNVNLSSSQVYAAFTNSLSRWKYAGGSAFDFTYSQSGSNPTDIAIDGVNAIFFSSQSGSKLGAGVIGATSTVTQGNSIVEFDIEFNDDAFTFTTNPADTTVLTPSKVFLENVATHELGHSLGLNHTGVLQGTMMWTEAPGQARLSCDDLLAVATAYPQAGFAGARGSISGVVRTSGGVPVVGAHALAISKTRGTVIEGQVTASDGSFTLTSLEPGDYYLAIEPFQEADVASSLCQSGGACAFTNANSATMCGGNPFQRMFVESSVGVPAKVTVAAAGAASVGTITAGCAAMTQAPAFSGAAALDAGTPVLISSASSGEAAVRGVIGATGSAHYYKLQNVSGSISAKVIAFNLYAPWNPTVQLVDARGAAVAGASSTADVFSSPSTYVNFDSSAALANAAAGDYYVKITNAGTPAVTKYPGASLTQIDTTPFYLLIVTLNDTTALLSLPGNARCEAADSFPAVPNSPPTVPGTGSSNISASGSSSPGATSGCGMISRDEGPGPEALFSAWGVLVMLGLARLLQQLARRHVAR